MICDRQSCHPRFYKIWLIIHLKDRGCKNYLFKARQPARPCAAGLDAGREEMKNKQACYPKFTDDMPVFRAGKKFETPCFPAVLRFIVRLLSAYLIHR